MYPASKHLRAGLAIALTAVAFSTAGCGGGESSSGSLAFSPSSPQGQLIAKADLICGRLNTELARMPSSSSLSPREIARAVPAHAALELAALRQLRGLVAPAAMASDWKRVIAERQALADELAELVRTAKANDTARIKALTAEKKQTHRALYAIASHVGFKDCAQVG